VRTLRIHRIEIDNFMRLRVVRLTPQGNVVQLTGENGSGKSSFLNAILAAVAGKGAVPTVPVRVGEGEARITLDLGDVVLRWSCTPDRETKVVLESAEGARFPKPQTLLTQLYNAIAFDPLEFLRTEPKVRLETLRRLVPLAVDIDALDRLNERDYLERRDWTRKAESAKERVALVQEGIDPAMDTTRIDVDAIVARMTAETNRNMEIIEEGHRRAQQRAARDQLATNATAAREQAAELVARAEKLEERAATVQAALDALDPLPDPIDVSELRGAINAAMRANDEIEAQERQRALHKKAVDDLTAASTMAASLTEAMKDRIRQKEAAIAAAPMPVPGLGFGAGDVLFNNLPFDQASTAEQIRVSMAIAMAANPKLRVVLIRDGSLLDAKSLAIVEQMAEEHDFQVFIETVRNDDKVGVVFVAGEVTAIDGVPVPSEPQEATQDATVGA
jgi:predicted ABC-type transport system involved in lysophospholipase L1 biosynthesis ATPase subunit